VQKRGKRLPATECEEIPATEWFLPTFGDVTFWNIVSSFVVISNASIYPFVTDLMLVVNVTGVSPETALP
jgi:hypothetical protein